MLQTTSYLREGSDGRKSASWYTAFYYLAEHVREVTGGALNHKGLYALVGSKGRYINHSNPTVRKRTAGTLSRIVHTKRYVLDMRCAYSDDESVFDRMSESICDAVRSSSGFSDAELEEWLVSTCWPDVRRGLINEASEWRRGLNLDRLDYEMSMLYASYGRSQDGAELNCVQAESESNSRFQRSLVDGPERLLSAMLYVIAFDHLHVDTARKLVDQRFSSEQASREQVVDDDRDVVLIKFANSTKAAFAGIWNLSKSAPFVIGRYTDCDAFELSGEVSRVHCRIFWEDGTWHLEDLGSRNGSTVRRSGEGVRVMGSDGAQNPFPLEFGDSIELPGGSVYLFSASVR